MAASDDARLPDRSRPVARIGGIGFYVAPVPAGVTADSYSAALTRRPGVAGAQPNGPVRRASVIGRCVNQPSITRTDIPSISGAVQWWPPPRTRPIAVLDTGVDPTVPELAGRVLPATDTIGGPPTNLPDDDGHGTQVASAAAGAPGLVAGISTRSPIMPIRIATANVPATEESIVSGLAAAVSRKAVVAVLAYSAPLLSTREPTVTAVGAAIDAAFDGGVITIVPAGNEGTSEGSFPGELRHVITVGSSGRLIVRDRFSNFGPWIDLVAPGDELLLPAPAALCPSGYATATGTSFSAGAVAGAAAWIAAARPSLGIARLYDVIRRFSAVDGALQGYDQETGFGLLDVGSGLRAKKPPSDPRELNDDVHWLKKRPAKFPTYLRRTRITTTKGSVSPAKDPRDAFKVKLRKHDVLRVSVKGQGADDLLSATIWDRRTGAFAMGRESSNRELRNSSGFARSPVASYRARTAGTYYVAVFAPDQIPPGEEFRLGGALPQNMAYSLTMQKRCSSSRRLRVPLSRLRRRGLQMTGLRVFVDGKSRLRRTRSGIQSRVTLNGLRTGRHRVVFKSSFGSSARRKSRATNIRARCTLRLDK